MKMLLSFILLSLFSCWSIHAKPFFEIKYSDGLEDDSCNGTAAWTNWSDIPIPESSAQFYMAMIQLNTCSKPIGMQLQFQSTIPNMNFDFGENKYSSNKFSYLYRSFFQFLNFYQSFLPNLKFQIRHCCENIESTSTTDSAPIQNYECALPFDDLTNRTDITSWLAVYIQHYVDEENEDTSEVCAGIMLDAAHVLIHASCVNQTDRISNAIRTPKDESPINIDTIIIHPEYDPVSKKNNLAIVKLANESEMPIAICLPFAGLVRGNNQTSILSFDYEGDFSASDAFPFMKNEVQTLKDCPGIDQDHEFCILESRNSWGVYRGTIRSLIFDIQGTQKVLTGISYRRRIPVGNDFALVYSRVEPYVPWILSVIKKN